MGKLFIALCILLVLDSVFILLMARNEKYNPRPDDEEEKNQQYEHFRNWEKENKKTGRKHHGKSSEFHSRDHAESRSWRMETGGRDQGERNDIHGR